MKPSLWIRLGSVGDELSERDSKRKRKERTRNQRERELGKGETDSRCSSDVIVSRDLIPVEDVELKTERRSQLDSKIVARV